jgi:MYXO-CTERM domain-containing protein
MVDVEFHNIDSDVYEEVGRIGLGAKGTISGTKVLHLVVEGNTVGAGTIEVITTSTLGGRVVKTLDYEVTSTSSSSTQPSSSESEQSPGAGIGLALIGLAFLARRK